LGGITNAGMISAGGGGLIIAVGAFSGGIVNKAGGVIDGDVGIVTNGNWGETFVGGITNAGTISGDVGIEFDNGVSFAGNIVNSAGGFISAIVGISTSNSTITGSIIDSGVILGEIFLHDSVLRALQTAVEVSGPTFTGGFVNFGGVVASESATGVKVDGVSSFGGDLINVSGGIISGASYGVAVSNTSLDLFDTGEIDGGSGIAVLFSGDADTLTLGGGYSIDGNVVAENGGAVRLGGNVDGNFNLGAIGTQFSGFTSFDVVGGNWTVSDAGPAQWTVSGAPLWDGTPENGTLRLASGGTLNNTLVASGGTFVVLSGGSANGITVNAGGTAHLASGAPETVSGIIFSGSGATLAIDDTANAVLSALSLSGLAGGGTVDLTNVALAANPSAAQSGTLSSGTLIVSGTIVNSGGTIFASGASSLVEITSGALVSGGLVEVGSGTVHVESGGSATNVAFLATASGGVLAIEDSANNASAFTGKVSGFGGVGHGNHHQFIDLVDVQSAGAIHLSYSASSGGSGTLIVTSNSTPVAQINMIGAYTSANFSAKADGNGNVEIFDPTVPNGGRVELGPAQPFPQRGIDLPNIAFGAQTTLAFAANATGTGSTLTVSDGRHAAAIALLGNYIAGSFAVGGDGHGGTLVPETPQTAQPLLTHPRA
jgi:autotransporter passenger strand-loop-strand repeat protein